MLSLCVRHYSARDSRSERKTCQFVSGKKTAGSQALHDCNLAGRDRQNNRAASSPFPYRSDVVVSVVGVLVGVFGGGGKAVDCLK